MANDSESITVLLAKGSYMYQTNDKGEHVLRGPGQTCKMSKSDYDSVKHKATRGKKGADDYSEVDFPGEIVSEGAAAKTATQAAK